MKIHNVIIWTISLVIFISCKEEYTPKPNGYFQLDLPEHAYQRYENKDCPCVFDIPVYASVEQESHFFDETPEHPCWLNINFPSLNATIYLSYKDVSSRERFEKVIEDGYKMTFKHSQKADFIDEQLIEIPQHQVFGYQFDVGGDAASSTQFFLTDSLKHYVRGALYFKSTPNIDSVLPALEFLKMDMNHLIESLQWK